MAQTRNYATTAQRTGVAIDDGLRSYMLGVYNYMGLGVAFTAVVTLLLMNNPDLMRALATGGMRWVLFFAVLGLGVFSARIIFSGSTAVAHGAYWLYCALWGALISPQVYAFFSAGAGHQVFRALAIAAATFGATSLYGYVTKRDMTGWGSFLGMASIGVIIAAVVSFFLISAVSVLLFSAITAWETQQIKDFYLQASTGSGTESNIQRSSVFGSFMLYGSFVTLFVHILNLLGIMGGEE